MTIKYNSEDKAGNRLKAANSAALLVLVPGDGYYTGPQPAEAIYSLEGITDVRHVAQLVKMKVKQAAEAKAAFLSTSRVRKYAPNPHSGHHGPRGARIGLNVGRRKKKPAQTTAPATPAKLPEPKVSPVALPGLKSGDGPTPFHPLLEAALVLAESGRGELARAMLREALV